MTSASIPSRRSLDVQLGPAAAGDHDDYNGTCESSSTAAAASVDELRAPTSRRTPRQSKMATTRVRWSRMAAPPGQPPAAPPPQLEPPPSLALLAAGSTSAASLCQLVDFGETRDLIRRQRETAKQLEEVQSIVSHLSLEQENSQDSRQQAADWATFRKQPNSQFKQYVFQSPGRAGLWLQGCSTDGARDEPGSLYGQFAHRKSKGFRLSRGLH
uniref:ARHGEF17 n=1 Tax=Macrostomum lignano TaxID=282301 RepID=A0A1I8HLP3_9PLAT